MALYQSNPLYTGAADEQRRADTETDQWRDSFMGGVDQWQQGRRGYANALQQQFVQARNPGAETAMVDSRRQNAFRQARRGTRGGSSDLSGRSRVQGDYAASLAAILSGGKAVARGQEQEDMATAQGLRQQAMQPGPGSTLATQSQLGASQARAGMAAPTAGLQQQGIADQQAFNNFISQLMGGQLSTAGGVINTAGRTGTGPAWAQALSRSLVGG